MSDVDDLDRAFSDAITGYALHVPCLVDGCWNDVEWWTNQHGCRRGHICDYHMTEYLQRVNGHLLMRGHVECAYCQRPFGTFASFFGAIRA